MAKIITHREMVHRVDLFFRKLGWLRSYDNQVEWPQADRTYTHHEKKFKLVVEIKPSRIGQEEIYKGIGQTIIWLPQKEFRPVLVIPESYLPKIKPTFDELGERVGLISYTDEGTPYIVKNNLEMDAEVSLKTKEPLKRILVKGFCECSSCGHIWKPHKLRRRPDLPRLCPKCQDRNVL